MASVSGRNARLALYTKALCNCPSEVVKYAACISSKDDVKKGDCSSEFIILKNCFQKAMKELIAKK